MIMTTVKKKRTEKKKKSGCGVNDSLIKHKKY